MFSLCVFTTERTRRAFKGIDPSLPESVTLFIVCVPLVLLGN